MRLKQSAHVACAAAHWSRFATSQKCEAASLRSERGGKADLIRPVVLVNTQSGL